MTDVALAPARRPLLRGVSHEIAFYVAVVAGLALVAAAPPGARVRVAVYAASLATLLGVSALYHRHDWAPAPRAVMRRLDHAAIFLLIAGTYTPFSLLLAPTHAHVLLAVAWGGATAGILQVLFWPKAPKPVIALIYVAFGWTAMPLMPVIGAAIGAGRLALFAAGGVAYSVGALVYARRRPNPFPRVFGYHEIFHALVVLAAVLHFVVVAGAVTRHVK